MSTQTLTASNSPLTVADSDTLIDADEDEEVIAVLPEVDDGSDATVAVDTEIRFENKGGGVIRVESFDGRLVARVPGRTSAVVTAAAGNQESEVDMWVVQPLANTPDAYQSISGSYTQAEIQALRDCLVNHGLMDAE